MVKVPCYFFECGCVIDWPAWIQALGSVVAILIAIWISRKDRNHANLVMRESNLRKMKVTYAIFEIAINVNQSVQRDIDFSNVFNGSYMQRFSTHGLNDLIFQLSNAPIFEYENADFATKVITIIRNLKLITERLESINQSNLLYVASVYHDITNSIAFIDSFDKPMKDIISAEEVAINNEKLRLV